MLKKKAEKKTEKKIEEKKTYPIKAKDYDVFEIIGDGVSAIVRRALCIPFNEIVAIKILDFERNGADLAKISQEAQTMVLINHHNVLSAHCSFVVGHNLWIVMPFMAGGSCLHIMKSVYPNGLKEAVIAVVLKEVLRGLEYLHQEGRIHRDVKAGNILVDEQGRVKLADFGVSAYLFDSGDRQRTRNTFVGTPCWMAPEVMEQRYGYDCKADIWSFGITALELAHGHAPSSSQPPMKVLLTTLNSAPPSLVSTRDKKFSRSFKNMIAACLVKDPSKRPPAVKLLNRSFFKDNKSAPEVIMRTILYGLPSLGERYSALKLKEAQLIRQKKFLMGEKEETPQSEYERGVNAWNFDLDKMKVQAALTSESEDTSSGKESEGCSQPLLDFDALIETIPPSVAGCSVENGVNEENNGIVLTATDLTSVGQHADKRPISNVSDNEYGVFNSSNQINIQDRNDAKGHANSSYSELEKHLDDDAHSHAFSEHNDSRNSSSSVLSPTLKPERVVANVSEKECKVFDSSDQTDTRHGNNSKYHANPSYSEIEKHLDDLSHSFSEHKFQIKQYDPVQDAENCNGVCNHNQVRNMPSEATSKASKSTGIDNCMKEDYEG